MIDLVREFRLRSQLRIQLSQPSNLVDPASSHMLVLKIKPCMSKYKLLYGETANGSLKQLWSPWRFYNMDTYGNSRANTCVQTRLRKGCAY